VFEAHTSDLSELDNDERDILDLKNLEIAGPATLLYGLAFENIIKAIIVKSEGVVIEQGKIKNWLQTHNLVNLATRAGIILTVAQRDLLTRLTAFVGWSGRYPIPMSQTKMPLKQEGVSPAWFPLPLKAHELGVLTDFYQTLEVRVLET
jgi:hypothetical protein